MIVWILLLPFIGAFIAWLFRDLNLVASLVSTATVLIIAFLSIYGIDSAPFVVLGRTILLEGTLRVHLSITMVILAVVFLSTWRLSESNLAWSLTLLSVGFFLFSLAMENITLSTLMLQVSLVTMIMLLPIQIGMSSLINLRILVILVLAGLLMLSAAWIMEQVSLPDWIPSGAGAMILFGVYALLIGIFPFFAWQMPIFRGASSLARVLFGVIVPHLMLMRILSLQPTYLAPIGELLPVLMLNAGIATFAIGCVGALVQHSISGMLGYVALSELGMVLMGLGTDTVSSRGPTIIHLVYRGLGIVGISIGIVVLRHSFGDDYLENLRGAFGRAPLTVLGVLLAGLSLAGWPPLAGFVTRLALFRAIAAETVSWAMVLILLGMGPAWAFIRYAIIAFRTTPTPGSRREPTWPAILVLTIGVLTLALGLLPQAIGYLPPNWTEIFLGLGAAGL